MDPIYITAFAALAGSMIGGLTSLVASWLSLRGQFRAQQSTRDVSSREELYKEFIGEASRLYADAFQNDKAEVSNLVGLFAIISRMQIVSSKRIVEDANKIAGTIIDMYQLPNRNFSDLKGILNSDAMNPLRDFSNACREELLGFSVY